jgi:hypothetical protein
LRLFEDGIQRLLQCCVGGRFFRHPGGNLVFVRAIFPTLDLFGQQVPADARGNLAEGGHHEQQIALLCRLNERP